MSPNLHVQEGGYTDFGADPVCVGIGMTLFLSAQYLVNQCIATDKAFFVIRKMLSYFSMKTYAPR